MYFKGVLYSQSSGSLSAKKTGTNLAQGIQSWKDVGKGSNLWGIANLMSKREGRTGTGK